MLRAPRLLLTILALSAVPAPLAAQQVIRDYTVAARRVEQLGEDHWALDGDVEVEQRDTRLYADHVEAFTKEDRVIATGNVLLTQGNNRIAADRADFNTRTRTGTFYSAYGIAGIQPPRPTAGVGGFVAPQIAGQETDVYFFGEVVEKLGPKKYQITGGGFSTCVQPTPRWELHASTVVLNIDHYTMLRNAIFRVKSVPLMYVPILYYPTKEENRATGFLLPTYGTSTVDGQTFSNAFFWAVDRSQDATIMHDWYSKTGQGLGGEYRYNFGHVSEGSLRGYVKNGSEATYTTPDGVATTQPASRYYEIVGGANRMLPGGMRARGYVDYFSSVTTMQTLHTNVYEASRSSRRYGANAIGAWGIYSMNATFDRSEYFTDQTNSVVTGSAPRISVNRTERPIAGSPVYFSVSGDATQFVRVSNFGGASVDTGLGRADFFPQIRFPFKRWQWFTVSSTMSWRDTFYTKSDADPNQFGVVVVDQALNRRVFTVGAQAVGPVFVKVWDTPDSGYAERFKHIIEPRFNVQRTSPIGNFERIIQTDGIDGIRGDALSVAYSLSNRFYAKRRTESGRTAQAEEILSIDVSQTYSTDALQAQYDRQYSSTFAGAPPSHFTPVRLNARVRPAQPFSANVGTEYDTQFHEFRDFSVSGNYSWTGRLQSSLGWSKRFYIEELPGYNDPNYRSNYLNGSVNARARDSRVGAIYDFYYNIADSLMQRQIMSAYYNAQCCGISVQYHRINYPPNYFVPVDRRFFLSFTLAGLGAFSPFNGAMSGVPR